MASIIEICLCCLQSCCSLKQCKLTGRLPGILLYFHMVASIASISPVACNFVVFSHIAQLLVACQESCCIFAHGQITGGFNNLHFPLLPAILLYFQTLPTHWWLQSLKFSLLPAILLYFQTLPTHWWLQLLKFASVACNLVVVSNNAKYLVASII